MVTEMTYTELFPLSFKDDLHYVNHHKVTFFVHDNVVIAKLLDDCERDVLDQFERSSNFAFFCIKDTRLGKSALMSRHPFGKAKCDPRDTFDEEYGCRLALKRLKVAYWSQYENRLGKVNEFLMKMFDRNSDRMTRISEKYLQGED